MKESEADLLIGWVRRFWLTPRPEPAVDSGPVDWPELARLAASNRVDGLLYRLLSGRPEWLRVPIAARRALEQAYQRRFLRSSLLAERMVHVLEVLASDGIPVLPLRGPAVGAQIYGEVALRPASDLDLLIRRHDLAGAKEALSEMGFGKPPRALPDRYYERNHLHLQYLERASRTSVELHWALDHKYTLLTVDYEGIFARSREVDLLGARALLMSREDWLLSLAIHLIKHCPWLGSALQRGRARDYLLSEGALLWLCDIAAAMGRWSSELDWPALMARARDWGGVPHLAWSLQAAAGVLGSPQPPAELAAPAASRAGLWLFDRAVASPASPRAPGFMGAMNSKLLFRPIRLLDLSAFFFPDQDYLVRRYGGGGSLQLLASRARHLTWGVRVSLTNLADVVRYSLAQALGRSA